MGDHHQRSSAAAKHPKKAKNHPRPEHVKQSCGHNDRAAAVPARPVQTPNDFIRVSAAGCQASSPFDPCCRSGVHISTRYNAEEPVGVYIQPEKDCSACPSRTEWARDANIRKREQACAIPSSSDMHRKRASWSAFPANIEPLNNDVQESQLPPSLPSSCQKAKSEDWFRGPTSKSRSIEHLDAADDFEFHAPGQGLTPEAVADNGLKKSKKKSGFGSMKFTPSFLRGSANSIKELFSGFSSSGGNSSATGSNIRKSLFKVSAPDSNNCESFFGSEEELRGQRRHSFGNFRQYQPDAVASEKIVIPTPSKRASFSVGQRVAPTYINVEESLASNGSTAVGMITPRRNASAATGWRWVGEAVTPGGSCRNSGVFTVIEEEENEMHETLKRLHIKQSSPYAYSGISPSCALATQSRLVSDDSNAMPVPSSTPFIRQSAVNLSYDGINPVISDARMPASLFWNKCPQSFGTHSGHVSVPHAAPVSFSNIVGMCDSGSFQNAPSNLAVEQEAIQSSFVPSVTGGYQQLQCCSSSFCTVSSAVIVSSTANSSYHKSHFVPCTNPCKGLCSQQTINQSAILQHVENEQTLSGRDRSNSVAVGRRDFYHQSQAEFRNIPPNTSFNRFREIEESSLEYANRCFRDTGISCENVNQCSNEYSAVGKENVLPSHIRKKSNSFKNNFRFTNRKFFFSKLDTKKKHKNSLPEESDHLSVDDIPPSKPKPFSNIGIKIISSKLSSSSKSGKSDSCTDIRIKSDKESEVFKRQPSLGSAKPKDSEPSNLSSFVRGFRRRSLREFISSKNDSRSPNSKGGLSAGRFLRSSLRSSSRSASHSVRTVSSFASSRSSNRSVQSVVLQNAAPNSSPTKVDTSFSYVAFNNRRQPPVASSLAKKPSSSCISTLATTSMYDGSTSDTRDNVAACSSGGIFESGTPDHANVQSQPTSKENLVQIIEKTRCYGSEADDSWRTDAAQFFPDIPPETSALQAAGDSSFCTIDDERIGDESLLSDTVSPTVLSRRSKLRSSKRMSHLLSDRRGHVVRTVHLQPGYDRSLKKYNKHKKQRSRKPQHVKKEAMKQALQAAFDNDNSVLSTLILHRNCGLASGDDEIDVSSLINPKPVNSSSSDTQQEQCNTSCSTTAVKCGCSKEHSSLDSALLRASKEVPDRLSARVFSNTHPVVSSQSPTKKRTQSSVVKTSRNLMEISGQALVPKTRRINPRNLLRVGLPSENVSQTKTSSCSFAPMSDQEINCHSPVYVSPVDNYSSPVFPPVDHERTVLDNLESPMYMSPFEMISDADQEHVSKNVAQLGLCKRQSNYFEFSHNFYTEEGSIHSKCLKSPVGSCQSLTSKVAIVSTYGSIKDNEHQSLGTPADSSLAKVKPSVSAISLVQSRSSFASNSGASIEKKLEESCASLRGRSVSCLSIHRVSSASSHSLGLSGALGLSSQSSLGSGETPSSCSSEDGTSSKRELDNSPLYRSTDFEERVKSSLVETYSQQNRSSVSNLNSLQRDLQETPENQPFYENFGNLTINKLFFQSQFEEYKINLSSSSSTEYEDNDETHTTNNSSRDKKKFSGNSKRESTSFTEPDNVPFIVKESHFVEQTDSPLSISSTPSQHSNTMSNFVHNSFPRSNTVSDEHHGRDLAPTLFESPANMTSTVRPRRLASPTPVSAISCHASSCSTNQHFALLNTSHFPDQNTSPSVIDLTPKLTLSSTVIPSVGQESLKVSVLPTSSLSVAACTTQYKTSVSLQENKTPMCIAPLKTTAPLSIHECDDTTPPLLPPPLPRSVLDSVGQTSNHVSVADSMLQTIKSVDSSNEKYSHLNHHLHSHHNVLTHSQSSPMAISQSGIGSSCSDSNVFASRTFTCPNALCGCCAMTVPLATRTVACLGTIVYPSVGCSGVATQANYFSCKSTSLPDAKRLLGEKIGKQSNVNACTSVHESVVRSCETSNDTVGTATTRLGCDRTNEDHSFVLAAYSDPKDLVINESSTAALSLGEVILSSRELSAADAVPGSSSRCSSVCSSVSRSGSQASSASMSSRSSSGGPSNRQSTASTVPCTSPNYEENGPGCLVEETMSISEDNIPPTFQFSGKVMGSLTESGHTVVRTQDKSRMPGAKGFITEDVTRVENIIRLKEALKSLQASDAALTAQLLDLHARIRLVSGRRPLSPPPSPPPSLRSPVKRALERASRFNSNFEYASASPVPTRQYFYRGLPPSSYTDSHARCDARHDRSRRIYVNISSPTHCCSNGLSAELLHESELSFPNASVSAALYKDARAISSKAVESGSNSVVAHRKVTKRVFGSSKIETVAPDIVAVQRRKTDCNLVTVL